MKKQIITVNTIKALADSQTGAKRFTLQQDAVTHCRITLKEGQTLESLGITPGIKVVGYEREITTSQGEVVNAWFYLNKFDNSTINSAVVQDFDFQMELHKQTLLARTQMQRPAKVSDAQLQALLDD